MTGAYISRRAVVGGVAGIAVFGLPGTAEAKPVSVARQVQPVPVIAQPAIRPRADWAGTRRVQGTIEPEDVRFLLVHHTLAPGNNYAAADVPRLIQGIYQFHTTQKGWPDVAYNFMVDQFGVIWETRAGSIEGPVRGDATGGNQGFSQLCCFLGDLSSQPPTDAAVQSMADLLAWLAVRYQVDTTPGQTASFTSLGSNRFAAGEAITVKTIAGHRDVSQTACPGEAGYEIVTGTLPVLVGDRLLAATPTTITEAITTTTTEPATTSTAGPTTTGAPTPAAPSSTTDPLVQSDELAVQESGANGGGLPLGLIGAGAGTLAVGGALFYAAKRSAKEPEPESTELTEPLAVPIPPDSEEAWNPAPVVPVTPQRVWWATAPGAPPKVRQRVAVLAQEMDAFASNPPGDEEADRTEWIRLERALAEAARDHQAAMVAARPGTVFLLRNGRSTVRVTAADGHIRRDSSAEALSVHRSEVAMFEVFFNETSRTPDIQVRSQAASRDE